MRKKAGVTAVEDEEESRTAVTPVFVLRGNSFWRNKNSKTRKRMTIQ